MWRIYFKSQVDVKAYLAFLFKPTILTINFADKCKYDICLLQVIK
jgi:hypothetical protein